jgi:hypothetical protein
MSFWDVWDRTFWAFMIVIGVGLLWITFIEPYGLACVGPGLVVALIAGGIFLFVGIRKMKRAATPSHSPQEEA